MQGMTRITTDLPTDLVEFVKEYKKKTGISQSRIYTEALKLLKKEVENDKQIKKNLDFRSRVLRYGFGHRRAYDGEENRNGASRRELGARYRPCERETERRTQSIDS